MTQVVQNMKYFTISSHPKSPLCGKQKMHIQPSKERQALRKLPLSIFLRGNTTHTPLTFFPIAPFQGII